MRQFFVFDSTAQKVPFGFAMQFAMQPCGRMSVGANMESLMSFIPYLG